MKKLRLDLDNLSVESFEADAVAAEVRGTVRGAGSTDGAGCPGSYPYYCVPQPISAGCGMY